MSTAEQRVQDAFIWAIPPNWFYQRIESTTGRGIPDMFVCREGVSFWIEFKAEKKVLRPEQWAWHRMIKRAHGDAFALIQKNGRWFLMEARDSDPVCANGIQLTNTLYEGTISDIITYLSEL